MTSLERAEWQVRQCWYDLAMAEWPWPRARASLQRCCQRGTTVTSRRCIHTRQPSRPNPNRKPPELPPRGSGRFGVHRAYRARHRTANRPEMTQDGPSTDEVQAHRLAVQVVECDNRHAWLSVGIHTIPSRLWYRRMASRALAPLVQRGQTRASPASRASRYHSGASSC